MRRTRVVGVVLVASLVVVVVGFFVLVHPGTDTITAADPADAVVVLAGTQRSVAAAQALVQHGAAGELVLSNPFGPDDPTMTQICHAPPAGYGVTCFVPDPSSTRGEARAIRALAREHGWRDVAVVTSTDHISRARMIVGRCYDGRLRMIDSRVPMSAGEWVYNVVYQTAAFVKAALRRGC